MMRRFSRRRRGLEGGQRSAIDGSAWWPRILAEGLIPTTAFEPWTDPEIPNTIAALARATLDGGAKAIVAFSPTSASEALVAGLAAAQQAGTPEPFTGTLFVIAPHWPMATRQLLDWIGQTPYTVEPISAVRLADGGAVVESERVPRLLAVSPAQLAARMPSSEARAAFTRAAASLEGLAAKHGGSVRIGIDRLELVVLARRVAEIRTDGDNAVLETQVGGRHATPLSAADLAGALDGLEGQLRRRLGDHKVRDGEDGLRGRVVAQLAAGDELRCVRAWPSPGAELDVVDAVGVDAAGTPVVVAVRQEFEWTALCAVLESLSNLAPLLPLLLADAGPPLRLGRPRLLLTAERFAPGLERTVAALTLSFELRTIAGTSGASLDLVSRAAGEGAESRFGRRGRRRGGRDRHEGSEDVRSARGDEDREAADDEGRRSGRDDERGGRRGEQGRGRDGERVIRGPLGPRAMLLEAESLGDAVDEEDLEAADAIGPRADRGLEGRDGGRGRSRRRRRPRRGGADAALDEAGSPADEGDEVAEARSEGREREDADDDARAKPRARFEEVSLMDLDDAPESSGSAPRPDSERGRGDRHRRSRRRGRRGGRGEEQGAPRGEDEEASETESDESLTAIELPLVGAEAAIEDDFVDADDLSEILSRLPDEVPEYEAAEPRYDDEEEEDAESPARPFRGDARARGRQEDDEESEDALRAAARRRCGDPGARRSRLAVRGGFCSRATFVSSRGSGSIPSPS